MCQKRKSEMVVNIRKYDKMLNWQEEIKILVIPGGVLR